MQSPIRLFIIVGGSCFAVELTIMYAVRDWNIAPGWLALVDAFALSIFASIPIFFLYHRPFIRLYKDLLRVDKTRKIFLDNAVEGIFGVDGDGNFTFANNACLRLLGYKAERELLGRNVHSVIHCKRPDGSAYPEKECKIYNAYRTKERIHLSDESLCRSDGSCFPAEYWSQPLDGRDDPTVLIISFLDITEHKRAEEQTKLNLARLEALASLNQMRDEPLQKVLDFALEKGVALTRSKIGLIGFLNDDGAIFRPISFSKTVMKECAIPDKHYEFPIENAGLWAEAIRQQKPAIVNDYSSFEHPHKKGLPEGHVSLKRFLGVPAIDGRKAVAMMAVGNKERDYSDIDIHQLQLFMDGVWNIVKRRRAEESLQKTREMLVRSEKLASLGELSAGVAHEIKNPLNIISTATQLLLMDEDIPKETNEACRQILQQVDRTVRIADNLRYFARKRKPEIKNVDLHDFIEKTVALVEYEMKATGFEIVRDFHGGPIFISADEDQLAQVFLNIINNARDSMNEKRAGHTWDELTGMGWAGRLTIETRVINRKACVAFEDTGVGISSENKTQVFDPFFTTKAEGKGTGLGLSVAYGIMESHGGTINLEGEEGKGVRVSLVFPLMDEDH